MILTGSGVVGVGGQRASLGEVRASLREVRGNSGNKDIAS